MTANTSQLTIQKSAQPIVLILGLALFIRLGWVLFSPALPTSDFAAYQSLAQQVAGGHGYPDSFRVPGYPYFLAAFFVLFGDHLIVPKLVNVVLGTLTCLFTYLMAKKVFGERAALIAGVIVALLPSHILYASLVASENLFTCLLLSSATLFLYASEREDHRWLLLAVSGFLLGLATLVRPLSLFLPGAWMLYLMWKRLPIKQITLITLIVSIATVATLTPWLIRNYRRAGRFVGLSTNGGITFIMGFNERANGHYIGAVRVAFEQEAASMGLDEFERNDLAFQRAFRFIRENPMRVITLIPLKWAHLFRDDVSGVVWNFELTSRSLPRALWYVLIFITQVYYTVLMALALASPLFLRKSYTDNRLYGFPLSIIIYWLAFHATLFGDDRFHLPILPFLAMFSALGLMVIFETLQSKGWRLSRHPDPEV